MVNCCECCSRLSDTGNIDNIDQGRSMCSTAEPQLSGPLFTISLHYPYLSQVAQLLGKHCNLITTILNNYYMTARFPRLWLADRLETKSDIERFTHANTKWYWLVLTRHSIQFGVGCVVHTHSHTPTHIYTHTDNQ